MLQIRGKKILIIGGTGTIGRGIINELLPEKPEVIRVFSRDEYKQFELAGELEQHGNLRYLLGDVRDCKRLARAMEDIDIVFHMAALKHVPACEYNPFEAVKTNVLGTQNVVEAAINNEVEKVIFTSTDKTINATNTYGASKLLAERLIAAANYYRGSHRTVFSAVRFGNVMGSRGSVIPLFKKQILERRKVTVTDPDMTRFMMTLSQAARLTLEACSRAVGGEVFILKMPVIRIGDLVEVVIEETCSRHDIDPESIRVDRIGLRPGEKEYEELMTLKESEKAVEFSHMFAVPPLYSNIDYNYSDGRKAKKGEYTSNGPAPLKKKELRGLLLKQKLV